MPPRRNPTDDNLGHNRNNKPNKNNNRHHNNVVKAPLERIIANESLLATESEKHATSKSLFGDPNARISSNVSAIHDRIRMRAYQSILKNIKGKSLLHLGCGMGLISMTAARSLASVVVAVDSSAIVDAAQVVAKQNGLQNISFFRGSLRETMEQFPIKKFDIILCEWMGAFLINEPLFDDAIYARDNLLAEGGVICPNGSSIHVVGVSDYDFHLDTVEFWSNVYGFKMEPMKELVWKEVSVCSIPAGNIVTSTCLAHTVHIDEFKSKKEGESQEEGFTAPFSVRVARDTTVNFLTFYVDATFTNPHDTGANFVISIRPGGSNAWTEASVALRPPLPVKCGEVIAGELRVRGLKRSQGSAVVEVTARTEGGVVAMETSGTYIYQQG